MTAERDRRTIRLPAPLVGVLAGIVLAAGLTTVAVRASSDDLSAARPVAPAGPAAPAGPEPEATNDAPTTTRALPPEPAYIAEIKAAVSELRGLEWKAPLVVEVVSRQEIQRRARAANDRDAKPDRLAGDGDTYRLLKVIPRGLDYAKALDDLLSGLILGFYDPKTKELVVRDSGGEVDAQTKVTIAHELDHALGDQWFDFGGTTDVLYEADRQEEYQAVSALIEGDAKLLESRYADRYLSDEEQIELLLGGLVGSGDDVSAVLELPRFMLGELYFPYTTGLEFAERQAAAKGFSGVDDAYRRPPVSTEQIIHPDRYNAGQGWQPPALPEVAAATSCVDVRRGTLGESTLAEVLDERLSTSDASAAVEGWNGDSFRAVRCGGALGMVLRIESDAEADAVRLTQAFTRWASAWAGARGSDGGRFSGPEGTGRISRAGTRVDLVLADDAATADRVAAALA